MFTLSSLATTVHFGDSASKIANVTDEFAHDWSSSLLSVTVKQRTVYMTRAKSLYSVWVCWPVNFLFSSLRLVSPLSLPAAALPSMEMHFSFEKIDFWAPPAERKSFLPSITHVVKHERAMKVESSFRSLQILKSESAFLIIIRYIKVKCDFFSQRSLEEGDGNHRAENCFSISLLRPTHGFTLPTSSPFSPACAAKWIRNRNAGFISPPLQELWGAASYQQRTMKAMK